MFVKSVNCITEIDQLIVYSASDYNSKGFFFVGEYGYYTWFNTKKLKNLSFISGFFL